MSDRFINRTGLPVNSDAIVRAIQTMAQVRSGRGFGPRHDGSGPKGNGFLGPLVRPDGGVSTELSMGTTDVNGRETDVPLLVPTLTSDQVRYLLSAPDGDWQNPMMRAVAAKAVDFARQRAAVGRPFFATDAEANTQALPDLPRWSR